LQLIYKFKKDLSTTGDLTYGERLYTI